MAGAKSCCWLSQWKGEEQVSQHYGENKEDSPAGLKQNVTKVLK